MPMYYNVVFLLIYESHLKLAMKKASLSHYIKIRPGQPLSQFLLFQVIFTSMMGGDAFFVNTTCMKEN